MRNVTEWASKVTGETDPSNDREQGRSLALEMDEIGAIDRLYAGEAEKKGRPNTRTALSKV
jgi:hypothetical protein